MLDYGSSKGFRLIHMYELLNKGQVLFKEQLVQAFGITEKTFQRDIDDLRTYLCSTHFDEGEVSIKYDRIKGGYYLVRMEREWLTNQEVLALCKILLESRAFCKEELDPLVDKLVTQASPDARHEVAEIIRNEKFHYVPLRHGQALMDSIWGLSQCILKSEYIEMTYRRGDGATGVYPLKPSAILFSEYYFYLIGFMADELRDYPIIFRVDRIVSFRGMGEKFHVPYGKKFNEGEFRKRVQFMYSGPLRIVTFEYSGHSVEMVLDRLPTAEIIKEEAGVYTIRAEVYGDGIDMWLGSQGDAVNVLD
ncbi:WYL domain-containing protein [Bengtsoniella intestinalis]|uniref:helix-turn-helix transcriptional regulator n=1 Tax=Bengtsoniella intestinalis TaxID=3073143 RepID=UPI00391F4D73